MPGPLRYGAPLIGVRLAQDDWDELRDLADDWDMSMSAVAREIIERWLNEHV